MARAINADELKSNILEAMRLAQKEYIHKSQIVHQIDISSTVDAVEVVHGRCKKSENREEWYTYEYTCLECGATMMVADVDGNDIAPNFCSNCGAKMDGETHEQ